jgi:hypothetical protein
MSHLRCASSIGTLVLMAAASAASAQDENPTTLGAIPDPGSYQGSMELQRQQDEQDRAFREQPQQRSDEQPSYGGSPQRSHGGGHQSAPRGGPAHYVPKVMPDFAANQRASAAAERGDYATAYRILRPLAEKGDMVAEYQYALMYERGAGVPQNYTTARSYYMKSAAQGFPMAMLNLAVLYGLGKGSPVDNVQSYRWFSLAIVRLYDPRQADNRAEAVRQRNIVASRMSKPELAKAQALARASRVPIIR